MKTRKRGICTAAAVLALSLTVGTARADGPRFTDVPEGAWCYDAVEYVVDSDILDGVTETEFRPDDAMTRAVAVSMLYRAEGRPAVILPAPAVSPTPEPSPIPEPSPSPGPELLPTPTVTGIPAFDPDEADAPFVRSMEARRMAAESVDPPGLDGLPDLWEDWENWGEMEGGEETESVPAAGRLGFFDVADGAWYEEAVAWGCQTGIAAGYDNGYFGPDDLLTRQQFMTMLYRLIRHKNLGYAGQWAYSPKTPDVSEVAEYATEAVCYMMQYGFVEGNNGYILPRSNVTRAQASAIVTRFLRFLADDTVYEMDGVYLGVEGYGTDTVNEYTKGNFRFRFFVDGEETQYPMDNGVMDEEGRYSYDMQNRLQEGGLYHMAVQYGKIVRLEEPGWVVSGIVESVNEASVTMAGGWEIPFGPDAGIWRITNRAGGSSVTAARIQPGNTVKIIMRDERAADLYLTALSESYTPPVSGTPGLKTVKNFLATALMPVGVTLYHYGGGWNWQITGASEQAREIGVPEEWVSFFYSQNGSYTYKDPSGNAARRNPARSYYPFGGWSEYYYAGADCAGFIGWALYNTMNTDSGGTGFVGGAMAKGLAERGWGSWTQDAPTATGPASVRPGDVIGISGHVYIALGTCSDGSVVILHSSPTESRSGQPGGGVQIGAVGTSKTCEAYRLATSYMSRYFPDWYGRYAVDLKSRSYFNFRQDTHGRFHWNGTGENDGLSDPDGIQNMSAAQALAYLFAG